MKDVKQRNRRRRQRKRSQNHKRSVLAISAVVLMLTVMVSANSMTLKAKNTEYHFLLALLQMTLRTFLKKVNAMHRVLFLLMRSTPSEKAVTAIMAAEMTSVNRH